jgi:uncharacterized damage-inducible protein DinB
MTSALVEAWRMSCEANRFLLRALPRGSLEARYAPRTRTAGEQFAHMHAVRIRWLTHAAADLARDLAALPGDASLTVRSLREAMTASEAAVATFLERCELAGSVPAWNGAPASFLAYLVAHEAHHRGLVMVTMRLAGHKLPPQVVYGVWDWGKTRSNR